MPNTSVPAAAEGLPKINRRLFLRNTAAAGIAGAGVVAPLAAAHAAPIRTPDERIAAAIEEIKAAYWEKFPNVPIRICTDDEAGTECVTVIPFTEREPTGQVTYIHNCKVVRREGGDA